MATTTPNFGWPVPTSSDLVKNGATAIEGLGDAIDASLLDLKGGTTGQVLKKATNTDMDFTWSADSAGMTNPMTTTGDTIYSSSGSTPARLGIGSTGQVLTVAGGVPSWATAGGASGPAFRAYPASDQSIPATTFTKVLFGSETFDTASNFASSTFTPTTAGYYQLNVNLYMAALTASNDSMQIWKNGSNYQTFHNAYATGEPSFAMGALMYLNGSTDYAEIYFYKGGSGSGTVVSGTTASSFSGVWIRS